MPRPDSRGGQPLGAAPGPSSAPPGYELLGELGRGGMGVVYRARDLRIGRVVALKMLLGGAHTATSGLERFRREAEAVASLNHPHIVQVYEVGEHQMLPFFCLEFCPGGSLDKKLNGRPLPARRAAELLRAVAAAVQSAHAAGIVHRDIKPGNILLTADGVPKLADFGLAKQVGSAGPTATGAAVGTPSYMAPEQADNTKTVGPAADIHALGAVLYELLTGRPPYVGESEINTIWLLVSQDPVPVRRLAPRVPADLETMTMKCLEKEPGKRYRSAGELSADLGRYLDGQAILARPMGLTEQAVRWCQRNRAVAGLATLLALTLMVAMAAVSVKWRQAETANADLKVALDKIERDAAESRRLREESEANAQAARAAESDAAEAAVTARAAEKSARTEKSRAEAETLRALLSEARALRLAGRPGWRSQALSNLRRLAKSELGEAELATIRGEAAACLAQFDLAEGHRLSGPRQPCWTVAFSPDSSVVATAGNDGHAFAWSVADGRRIGDWPDPDFRDATKAFGYDAPLPTVAFHPRTGELLSASWDRRLRVLAPGGASPHPQVPADLPVRWISFDRAGKLMALARAGVTGYACVLRTADGRELARGPASEQTILHAAVLSPDGRFAAYVGRDKAVWILPVPDVESGAAHPWGRDAFELGRHRGEARAFAVTPDSRYLASVSDDQSIKVWDTASRQEHMALYGHTARVNRVAYSPDGRFLASASDDESVRLWEARTGRALMSLRPRLGPLLSVGFSSDGRRLAAGYVDLQTWTIQQSAVQSTLLGHRYGVNDVSFHPRRPVLLSGSSDQDVRLWDAGRAAPLRTWHFERPLTVARTVFSPDGALIAVGGSRFLGSRETEFPVALLDGETLTVRRWLKGPDCAVGAMAFDAVGRRLAFGGDTGAVWTWDVDSGQLLWRTPPTGRAVRELAWADRALVVLTFNDLRTLDEATGQPRQQLAERRGLRGMALAANRRSVLLATADGEILRVALTEPLLSPVAVLSTGSKSNVHMATDSRGRLLATADDSRETTVWDVDRRRAVIRLPAVNGSVYRLALAPGGSALAIAGVDHDITVWHLDELLAELDELGLSWR